MLIEADLEGTEVLELGNGHFLILIFQNRKQHRQIVIVYVSTMRRLYVKN